MGNGLESGEGEKHSLEPNRVPTGRQHPAEQPHRPDRKSIQIAPCQITLTNVCAVLLLSGFSMQHI